MTKIRDLVPIFEQTAARRAQDALHAQVSACFTPLRHGWLTEIDCQRTDEAGREYMREHRRHQLWLKRRLENAGMSFVPYGTT